MASTTLTKTFGSTGNRKIFTISTWLKRASTARNFILSTYEGSGFTDSNALNLSFDTSGIISIETGSSSLRQTSAVYRDVSAWYHLVLAVDTTQATASNRLKLYINGSEVTSFTTNNNVAQNTDMAWNHIWLHRIGASSGPSLYFDGSMASFYSIDGQALTPSSFGETDATTGIWKPKSYAGSYGTNGFFLKFENSGSLGTDSSGNGNNFTVNGTPTQTVDTPSNVFCTLNPLDKNTITSAGGTVTFTNGNLTGVADNGEASGTFAVSKGKWYFECRQNTGGGNPSNGIGWYPLGTSKEILYRDTAVFRYDGGTENAYGAVWYNSGDIVGVALDLDNTTISYYKNGVSQGNAKTDLEAGTYMPLVLLRTAGYSISVNFGNGRFGTTAISSPFSDGAGLGKFQYQPPTGYYSLCTKNINIYG